MGSSSYISNLDGEVVQHIEYVPFGEVFLEEKNAKWNTPYLFTSKELDRETGLYYFGARYYDPKTSVWISVDPLAVYNPVMQSEFYYDGDHNGGMYNSGNLNTYGYCYQNPVLYVDPNGKQNVAGALIGAVVGGGIELGGQLLSGKSWEGVDWADVGIESAKGAVIGFNPALAGVAQSVSVGLKASVDLSENGGLTVIGGQGDYNKSLAEVGYDAATDVVAGKLGDAAGKQIGKIAEGSLKKVIKAETKAVKSVVYATNKFNKATNGGRNLTGDASKKAIKKLDIATSTANAARKNTVRAQMIKGGLGSPAGTAVNEAAQNTVIDRVKEFFGIGK